MPTWTGFFGNPKGSPLLRISVYGVWPQSKQEFDAVVDTGFTGFLSMPLVSAFPLGLVLFGTTSVVLADGTRNYRLTAFGTVAVSGEERHGIIVLEAGSDEPIVGMEFLEKFGKTLNVSPGRVLVELADDGPIPPPAEVGDEQNTVVTTLPSAQSKGPQTEKA